MHLFKLKNADLVPLKSICGPSQPSRKGIKRFERGLTVETFLCVEFGMNRKYLFSHAHQSPIRTKIETPESTLKERIFQLFIWCASDYIPSIRSSLCGAALTNPFIECAPTDFQPGHLM